MSYLRLKHFLRRILKECSYTNRSFSLANLPIFLLKAWQSQSVCFLPKCSVEFEAEWACPNAFCFCYHWLPKTWSFMCHWRFLETLCKVCFCFLILNIQWCEKVFVPLLIFLCMFVTFTYFRSLNTFSLVSV